MARSAALQTRDRQSVGVCCGPGSAVQHYVLHCVREKSEVPRMNPGVGIWRCTNCREPVFPQRLLCPNCHGDTFAPDRLHTASVEEVSVIRHMIGQTDWQPRRIASVRTAEGLRLTVGLTDDSGPGTVIELWEEGTAPFGRAKGAR